MTTDPDRLEALFAASLATPLSERGRFADQACAGDDELRQRLEALLSAHEEAGNFLNETAKSAYILCDLPAAQDIEALCAPTRDDAGLKEHTRIGAYKLLQQLGEGGMGVVYLAEQQEPLRRVVALKIIKPGMDSQQVIARFEAERQALALMDHPHIARVFDASTTPSGLPFFVMELVRGVSITRYCDEHHLTLRERLQLFVPVCQAVQHANLKGIIHRDLKPSNVLVALCDGKPVPKVIDFGVAKAVGPKLTERTLFTEFGSVIGTLEYMSPEQADTNQLDVDHRSDVYALGVLLYELLTGTTPLERRRLKETVLLEALRLIREEEPPTPSNRLGTTEELPAIAANRGLEPKKLGGMLRGELDWIAMKSLEKDRARRYQTADSLARDIERFLAGERVEACPPSPGYRLRKFTQRHKKSLRTAAAFALLLLAGLALGTWMAVWALTPPEIDVGPPLATPITTHPQRETGPLKEPVPGPKDKDPSSRQLILLERHAQMAVDFSTAMGVQYLRDHALANGGWGDSLDGGTTSVTVGLASLSAFTLLECGVRSNDPVITRAATLVRQQAGQFPEAYGTYQRALAILFLDRLRDPQDEELIQYLALSLIAGQHPGEGAWGYSCPALDRTMVAQLAVALRHENQSLDDWRKTALKGNTWSARDWDNSNTQLAVMALWAALRHNVAIDRPMALVEKHFRATQRGPGADPTGHNLDLDGSWFYDASRTASPWPTMTCAGLTGLAVAHGTKRDTKDRNPLQDQAIQRGLKMLGREIDRPKENRQADLYYLWSLERVAVLFQLPEIAGKDWFSWGRSILLPRQQADGSWRDGGFYGSSPVTNTCFALLFLKQANLAYDLSAKLQLLSKT
jgi:serine/threonine protein kinase